MRAGDRNRKHGAVRRGPGGVAQGNRFFVGDQGECKELRGLEGRKGAAGKKVNSAEKVHVSFLVCLTRILKPERLKNGRSQH